MNRENYKKLKTIMNHYGFEKQCDVVVEECAELIQAIQKGKHKNWDDNNEEIYEHLKEEVVDVFITVEQMIYFLMLDGNEFNQRIAKKLDRQIDRINQKGGSDD